MVRRQLVAGLLAAFLALPGPAAPVGSPTVVGITTSSSAAWLRNADLRPGATVLSGDLLTVGPGGDAVISLSSDSLLRFGPHASARLLKSDRDSAVAVELLAGQLRFRTTASAPVEVRLADAVIRSADDAPALATVWFLSPSRVVVATEKGAVTVSTARDSRRVTVREGQSVEITYADAPPPKPQATQPAGRTGQLSPRRTAIVGAVVIITISLLALSTHRGDRLSRTDINRLLPVSPTGP